jgi:hypothetical protein
MRTAKVDSLSVSSDAETKVLPPLCSALSGNCANARGLSILQPRGLNLIEALTRCGLAAEWRTQKAEDKLACVVHLILEGAHRDFRHSHPGYFVPLHSRRLETLLGSRFASPALTALRTAGIVEANERYSSGNFTKSYRLTEKYRDDAPEFRALNDACLIRKLRSDDTTRTHVAIGTNAERYFVWQSLRRTTFSPAAWTLCDQFNFTSSEQRASWLLSLRGLWHGLHWLRADENTGRIFHNITQCPRELRPLLLIDGERAAEVDIANAQPFLALSLYPKDHPERHAYASFVTSGDFYAALFQAMPRKARRPWGSDPKAWTADTSRRDRFKVHALRHILYDVTPSKPPAIFETFAELFPWLAGELAMKRATKAGASALARELQRAEADLVLGRVIPGIRATLSGCNAITIHDGILCGYRYAEAVRWIVEEEAKAVFGVPCVARMKSGLMRVAA